MSQSRRWCVTLFDAEPVYDGLLFNYMVGESELAPGTGRRHWQYYVEFRTKQRLSAVKRQFPGAHLEISKGSLLDNQIYCTKDGTDIQEFGIPMNQGARTDLMEAAARVQSGESVDTICMENPLINHQYGRTLDRIERIVSDGRRRVAAPRTVVVLWGSTGIGKSRWWFSRYPDAYIKPYGEFWRNYRGERVVVLEEYDKDPNIERDVGQLLQWTDRYPTVPINVKNGHAYLLAVTFIFTATKHYSEWWQFLSNKDEIVAQFARRVTLELDEAGLRALHVVP